MHILHNAFATLGRDNDLLDKSFPSIEARMEAIWKRLSGKPCKAMGGRSSGAFGLLGKKPHKDEVVRCFAPYGLLHTIARGHERVRDGPVFSFA